MRLELHPFRHLRASIGQNYTFSGRLTFWSASEAVSATENAPESVLVCTACGSHTALSCSSLGHHPFQCAVIFSSRNYRCPLLSLWHHFIVATKSISSRHLYAHLIHIQPMPFFLSAHLMHIQSMHIYALMHIQQMRIYSPNACPADVASPYLQP